MKGGLVFDLYYVFFVLITPYQAILEKNPKHAAKIN